MEIDIDQKIILKYTALVLIPYNFINTLLSPFPHLFFSSIVLGTRSTVL